MREIKLESPQELERYLEEHPNDSVLALFIASGGWCYSSCTARGFIEEVFEKFPEETVLMFDVGSKQEDWNSENPYKSHPLTKVRILPTLIKYKEGLEVGRLEEGDLVEDIDPDPNEKSDLEKFLLGLPIASSEDYVDEE